MDEFKNLDAQDNDILKRKPNHLMVGPEVFLMADGAANVDAVALALTFIEWVRSDPDDDDDEETTEARKTLGEGGEMLLAMLWALDKGGLTQITLTDPMESPDLNDVIRKIKGKVSPNRDRERESSIDNESVDEKHRRDDAWAISSESIVR